MRTFTIGIQSDFPAHGFCEPWRIKVPGFIQLISLPWPLQSKAIVSQYIFKSIKCDYIPTFVLFTYLTHLSTKPEMNRSTGSLVTILKDHPVIFSPWIPRASRAAGTELYSFLPLQSLENRMFSVTPIFQVFISTPFLLELICYFTKTNSPVGWPFRSEIPSWSEICFVIEEETPYSCHNCRHTLLNNAGQHFEWGCHLKEDLVPSMS